MPPTTSLNVLLPCITSDDDDETSYPSRTTTPSTEEPAPTTIIPTTVQSATTIQPSATESTTTTVKSLPSKSMNTVPSTIKSPTMESLSSELSASSELLIPEQQQQQQQQQQQPQQQHTSTQHTFEEFENATNNLHEGYMFLKTRCLLRQWTLKPKYFILTPHYIYCFKRRGDLASIPRDVIPLEHLSVSIDDERRGPRKHWFLKLDSPITKKTFNMFCFSMEERDQWLSSILQVLARHMMDAGYVHRYLKSSYSSRSLSRLTGHHVRQPSVELNKMSSLSCMELTNLGFTQEQKAMRRFRGCRRQTVSDVGFDAVNLGGDGDSVGTSEPQVSGFRKAFSFSSYHMSSLDAGGCSSDKMPYCRKKVKRHHSTSASILGRLSHINTMNIRNSTLGSTIRTSLIEKLKKT